MTEAEDCFGEAAQPAAPTSGSLVSEQKSQVLLILLFFVFFELILFNLLIFWFV